MKQFKFLKEENKMKQFLKVYLTLLLLMTLALAALPGSAQAITAANAQIINAAQLSYYDGIGTQVKTASVTVTVTLVPSAPTIAVGGPYNTNYSTGAFLDDTFTITSTANGPDTYNLSAATGTQVNNGSTGTAGVTSGSSVVIGATVTVGTSTVSAITVPSDGVNDGVVNGIAVGDTVVIGGIVRIVASVTDNASGTSTINLTVPLASAPSAGILVAGQKTVTVRVMAGTIVTPGVSVVVPADLTALSNTDNSKTTTSGYATNTFFSGLATLSKYVRNVTTDNHTGGSTAYTFAGNSNVYYYNLTGTAVNAKPGEVLEYLLVAINSGTGQVTSAVITDSVPTQYVTFKTGVYSAKDFQYWPNVVGTPATSLTFTAASTNDDPAQYIASTLTVNVGGNPPPSLPTVGGTIPSNTTVAVIYQATVNP
jgi:hypothetical protein